MADNFKYTSINGVILETDKLLADLEDLHYPSINGAILGRATVAVSTQTPQLIRRGRGRTFNRNSFQ